MNIFKTQSNVNAECCSQEKLTSAPVDKYLMPQCFFFKVLSTIHELTSHTYYHNGLKSRDIINHMLEKYSLDGDVKTQVHVSLQQSLAYGFLTKENGKYKLIGPMARVMQEPQSSQER